MGRIPGWKGRRKGKFWGQMKLCSYPQIMSCRCLSIPSILTAGALGWVVSHRFIRVNYLEPQPGAPCVWAFTVSHIFRNITSFDLVTVWGSR